MNRFIPIGLGILTILIALAVVFSSRNRADDTDLPTDTPTTTATSATGDELTDPMPTATTHEITFNGAGYSPSTLSIKQGDTVKFINQSSKAMWPASDNHPFHTKYSEFDPNKSVPAGDSYSFTFTKKGAWGFHDHLNSSLTGTITVQ